MSTRRLLSVIALVFALSFAISEASASVAIIRRIPGAMTFGPKPVWTLSSTSSTLFHALGDPMPVHGMNYIRVVTEMGEDTGNCKVRPALRWSNDGSSWDDTATPIVAAYVTAPGISAPSSWIDIHGLGTPKPWVQFGVEALNENGTAFEMCSAAISIELKEN